jgi:hypothetical protein
MALPTFDPTLHDISIGGFGWMMTASDPQAGTAAIQRIDATPSVARSAKGEGDNDRYQIESFVAFTDWAAGAGQSRLLAIDRYLSGFGDGRFQSHFFPPVKKSTEPDGGTSFWYFERLESNVSVLYGMRAANIDKIGTATTVALASGTPMCQPIASGANNVLWVTNESGAKKIRRWDGSTVADKTIANVTPALVGRLGRYLWAFGTRTVPATPALVQQARSTSTAAGKSRTATWTQPTQAGSTLLMGVTAYPLSGTTLPVIAVSAPWIPVPGATVSDSAAPFAVTTMYYIEGAASRSGSESVTISNDTSALGIHAISVNLVEFSGLLLSGSVDDAGSNAGTTTWVSPTLNTTNPTDFVWFCGYNESGTTTTRTVTSFSNSFTEGTEGRFNSAGSNAVTATTAYRQVSATGAYVTTGTMSGAITHSQVVGVALASYNLTADVNQTTLHYTADDGNVWTEAFQGASAGMPVPIACLAAQGFLWLTTNYGLYRMTYTEKEYEDRGPAKIIVDIQGPIDEWQTPKDVGNIGSWIAAFDGGFYYNIGGTIRRLLPGGEGTQIWPTTSWAGVAGSVKSLISGEGGIYFSAAGVLWNYDGHGFHQLLKEQVSGDFDYLHWFQGKLYGKSDPALYYDFGYPSMRPDLYTTAGSARDTGYWVSSIIDLEAVAAPKMVLSFSLLAEWTATSNSGTLTLQYLVGDSGIQPERLLPDSGAITWTDIGSMTVADGNYKEFTLAAPLEFRRLYLRVKLDTGATGYPSLEGVTVNGEKLYPDVKRFPLDLDITTNTVDKSGVGQMYPTVDDVQAAEAQLIAWRTAGSAPRYQTLKYVTDPVNSQFDTYFVFLEQLNTNVLFQQGSYYGVHAAAVFRQLR